MSENSEGGSVLAWILKMVMGIYKFLKPKEKPTTPTPPPVSAGPGGTAIGRVEAKDGGIAIGVNTGKVHIGDNIAGDKIAGDKIIHNHPAGKDGGSGG